MNGCLRGRFDKRARRGLARFCISPFPPTTLTPYSINIPHSTLGLLFACVCGGAADGRQGGRGRPGPLAPGNLPLGVCFWPDPFPEGPRRPAPTFLPWTLFSGPRSSLLLPVLPAPGGHPEAPAPPSLATTGVARGRSGVARTREAAAPGTGAGRREGAGSGPRRGAGPGAGTCAPNGAGPPRGLGRAWPRARRERLGGRAAGRGWSPRER